MTYAYSVSYPDTHIAFIPTLVKTISLEVVLPLVPEFCIGSFEFIAVEVASPVFECRDIVVLPDEDAVDEVSPADE